MKSGSEPFGTNIPSKTYAIPLTLLYDPTTVKRMSNLELSARNKRDYEIISLTAKIEIFDAFSFLSLYALPGFPLGH